MQLFTEIALKYCCLFNQYGRAYEKYVHTVPRWLPRFRVYRGARGTDLNYPFSQLLFLSIKAGDPSGLKGEGVDGGWA